MRRFTAIYLFYNKNSKYSHQNAIYNFKKGARMAKKIYFGSLKGGTGTTTVCVGIGIALADMGEKTLIIDGDDVSAGAMIVSGLGNMQVYTLADYERAACRAKQAATAHPKAKNLHVMPTLGLKNRALVEKAVGEIEGLYDYILLDRTAAEICDEAIIVTEPYLPSIKSADCCKSALADSGIKNISLIVNKLNGGQVAGGEVYSAKQIAEILRLRLLAVIPEDNTLPIGRWRKQTVTAFKAAASTVLGKNCDLYNVLRGYTGLNGAFKRKLRNII